MLLELIPSTVSDIPLSKGSCSVNVLSVAGFVFVPSGAGSGRVNARDSDEYDSYEGCGANALENVSSPIGLF